MNSDQKNGPVCSIDSRPDSSAPLHIATIKNLNVHELKEIITTTVSPVVIIVDALWCGDCRNQMKQLPTFQKDLKALGVELYIFTAEGENYDQFLSPEHKQAALQLYATPIGASVYGPHQQSQSEDTSSVMAVRGREGYPGTFCISGGVMKVWGVEDVSESQLKRITQKISEVLKS